MPINNKDRCTNINREYFSIAYLFWVDCFPFALDEGAGGRGGGRGDSAPDVVDGCPIQTVPTLTTLSKK